MAGEVHSADIGTVFEATLRDFPSNAVVNLSGASVMQLIFKKPSTAVLTKTAVHTTDGTDGKIRYLSVAGDLNELGVWEVQGYVETAAGKWHSDVLRFRVYPNLN